MDFSTVIDKNLYQLQRKIALKNTSLWDALVSKGVIDLGDKLEITDKYFSERDQVEQLLRRIQRGNYEKFKVFCAILKAEGQGHVVDINLSDGAFSDELEESLWHRKKTAGKYLILSHSESYLQHVNKAVEKATGISFHEVHMPSAYITDRVKGFVKGSQFILLVALWNQRLIIISDKEDSQLGKVYFYATREQEKKPFLILAGDRESDNLCSKERYHESLEEFIQNQSEVMKLNNDERFISLGRYIHEPLHLNDTQQEAIRRWLSLKL